MCGWGNNNVLLNFYLLSESWDLNKTGHLIKAEVPFPAVCGVLVLLKPHTAYTMSLMGFSENMMAITLALLLSLADVISSLYMMMCMCHCINMIYHVYLHTEHSIHHGYVNLI